MSTLEFSLGFLTVISGIVSYFLTRRSDLRWKRTEFIIQQSQFLDTDPNMREITLVLYGRHPKKSVNGFLKLSMGTTKTMKLQDDFLLQFEQYLNFLWRISYAYCVLNTLTRKDLNCFGALF